MKLAILVVTLALMCGGCKMNSETQHQRQQQYVDEHTTVVVIDGCQYLYYSGCSGVSVSHKGNCTNSIHLYNNR